MNETDPADCGLRARFAALRAADAARAPGFARVRDGRNRSAPRRAFFIAAAAGLVAVAVFRSAPEPRAPVGAATVAAPDDGWATPSDALLADARPVDEVADTRRLVGDIEELLRH